MEARALTGSSLMLSSLACAWLVNNIQLISYIYMVYLYRFVTTSISIFMIMLISILSLLSYLSWSHLLLLSLLMIIIINNIIIIIIIIIIISAPSRPDPGRRPSRGGRTYRHYTILYSTILYSILLYHTLYHTSRRLRGETELRHKARHDAEDAGVVVPGRG